MPCIYHQLIIGASASKVYNALTNQESVSAWWTPDAALNPEVGSIACFPFGPSYFKEMQINELIPSVLVRWTCVHGDPEWIGTTITFRLKKGNKSNLLEKHPEMSGQIQQQNEEDDLTLLMFTHDNWQQYTPMFAECSYTWALFLRSLKLLCEAGSGRPWPNQHRVE